MSLHSSWRLGRPNVSNAFVELVRGAPTAGRVPSGHNFLCIRTVKFVSSSVYLAVLSFAGIRVWDVGRCQQTWSLSVRPTLSSSPSRVPASDDELCDSVTFVYLAQLMPRFLTQLRRLRPRFLAAHPTQPRFLVGVGARHHPTANDFLLCSAFSGDIFHHQPNMPFVCTAA